MKRIYLDNAAATPVDSEVKEAMEPYFSEQFHNPSALYIEAREAKASLEIARAKVARLIGAKPSEVIFTAGGTESDNLAVQGVMANRPDNNLVISAVEHDAVFMPVQMFNHAIAGVDNKGLIDLIDLRKKIDDSTVLISIILANNEIGTIQSMQKIASLVSEVRDIRKKAGNKTPIYLHSDACQAPLFLDIHVGRLGVDLMTLNGGKMHGPKHSGILYVKAGINIQPLIRGGGQEMGIRSGTENVAFAIGFAKALELADRGRQERVKNVASIRDYFIEQLEKNFDAKVNGHKIHRIANNIHVTFEGCDNERVLFSLDDQGISAASGSACSASKDEPSRVLKALGLTDEQARSSLRFSIGPETTLIEIDSTLEKLMIALKA